MRNFNQYCSRKKTSSIKAKNDLTIGKREFEQNEPAFFAAFLFRLGQSDKNEEKGYKA